MRTIGVVTVGRSDYGIYLPILRRVQSDSTLKLQLIVSGAHLSSDFGKTVEEIEMDGFAISERIEMLLSSDSPEAISKAVGLGVIGYAQAFSRCRPDILLVLGDRFEMHAAAVAALPFGIPVAHIHGGEITEGAFDDALRHSMTKLSHLHFPSTEQYAQRLLQMGEEAWRVTVSGAPSLDNLRSLQLLSADELSRTLGLRLNPAPLLVTWHPVTLESGHTESQTRQLLDALGETDLPLVFTAPNADTNRNKVARMIEEFVARRPNAALVKNLGTKAYFSIMALAAAMVGNSSSGIIEAASFKLPVVNIGSRQKGRLRATNVLDVGYSSEEIVKGIAKAIDPRFRASLHDLRNPYGDGRASEIIVSRLKDVALDERLIKKVFVDFATGSVLHA